jgi:uncharacterized protein (TIGR03437 family)
MNAILSELVRRSLPLALLGLCSLGAAIAQPRLRLSETTVGPVSVAVGANGPARTIDATNAGSGSLNLSATSSVPWIAPTIGAPRTCSIIGGTTCIPVQIALNTTSLTRGVYTGIVTVADPNAIDAPQTITVTVQVGGSVPDSTTLFLPARTGATTSTQFFTNSTIQGTPSTSTGGNWLSLAFDGASSFAFTLPYAIRATNPGLAEGTYNGSLAITGSTFAPDNKTVPVTLNVTSQPIIALSQRSLRLRLAQTAATQSNFINCTNSGLGSLTLAEAPATVSAGAAWLTASRFPGTNFIQIDANPSSLAPGNYSATVTINSNAANGAQIVPVELQVVASGPPQVSAGGVVDNATFAGNDELGRGTIAAVFGEQFLMTAPVAATSLPLQTTMSGVRVLVNNQPAPVYYASYGQINFQIPFDAPEGLTTVAVERDGVRSNLTAVRIANRSPRLLTFGNFPGYGIIVNQDGTYPLPASAGLGTGARPARSGDTLVIYALGLGPTVPTVASGAGAPTSPLAVISPAPGVVIGANSIAQVDSIVPDFVGLTPNFVGLYQINVRVPAQVERGNAVPLYINFGAQVSNRVNLAIQ